MTKNNNHITDIIDFLDGMTNRQLEDYNTFELLPMNTVMGILNDNLDDSIKTWNDSLPNSNITPIRKIGTQTLPFDYRNLKFRVFNILGFAFSDGSELSICSDGLDGLEIVSFKIAVSKKGLGLDEMILELFLSFCLKSILYIPSITITLNHNHPHFKSILNFFFRFDFQKVCDEYEMVTLRKKEEFFSPTK